MAQGVTEFFGFSLSHIITVTGNFFHKEVVNLPLVGHFVLEAVSKANHEYPNPNPVPFPIQRRKLVSRTQLEEQVEKYLHGLRRTEMALSHHLRECGGKVTTEIDQVDFADAAIHTLWVQLNQTKDSIAKAESFLASLREGKEFVCPICGESVEPERIEALVSIEFYDRATCMKCAGLSLNVVAA